MFGSKILDVAIGLSLIYLLLSLIASAVREMGEAIFKTRAVELELGIRELMGDPDGAGLSRLLYEHPLIASLYKKAYQYAKSRQLGRNLPAYIPARNFATALLDMTVRGTGVPPEYAAQQTSPALTIAGLRASVQRLPSPFVQRAVLSAIDNAQNDVERVRENLEAWFDSAMDRVSGGYKRRTQFWLFAIGLGLALALNINTIAIADYLAHNETAREALARRAEMVRTDSAYRRLVTDSVVSEAEARAVYADLQSLNLPIGWDRQLPLPEQDWGWFLLKQIVGLLATAFAVMLGAPFWFDMLNKIGVVRATVKPHEKSPEEGSEDRQPKGKGAKGGAAGGEAAAAAAATREGAGGAGGAAPDEKGGRTATAVVEPEPPHEDREWAEGDNRQEGII